MNLPTLFLLLTGVLLNACAQLFLKAGVNATGPISFSVHSLLPTVLRLASHWPIWGGLLCYAVSLIIWIVALSRVDVSIAYPLLSLGYIVNAFAAWYFFGETLTAQKLIAIGIIFFGVYLLARS